MRTGALALLASLLAGGASACSAKLLPPDQQEDAPPFDTAHAIDTAHPIDATPDARPCTGGDVSMMDANGTCWLYFNATAKTWADAKTACEAVPATFAKVTNADEQAFVVALAGNDDVWIGGGDMATEGTYVWYDNTPIAPAYWHSGEPNNGNGSNEDCIVVNGARGGTWDDRQCTGSSGMYGYFCRFTP